MKGKLLFVFAVIAISLAGCRERPPIDKLFNKHLVKEVILSGYDSVYVAGQAIAYERFREMYPFLTINYVDENCSACKVKIIDWCNNINKIPESKNLAHLFIYRGNDHGKYLSFSCEGAFPFFVMPSKDFTYIHNNPKIDRQIIDAGFLIDKNNKIKVIGDPFLSENMRYLVAKMVETP
jgi:hypothetical protein